MRALHGPARATQGALLLFASLTVGCVEPSGAASVAPLRSELACKKPVPLPRFAELVLGDPRNTNLASNAVLDVAFHPASERLLAASPNGVSVSSDGGRTWSVSVGSTTGVRRGSFAIEGDLVISPTMQRSRDGGRSWTPLELGTGVNGPARLAIASGVLYAAREDEALLRSLDGGETFHALDSAASTAWDVAADGDDLAVLQAAAEEQGFAAYFEVSRDRGQTFVPVGMPFELWTDEVYPWGPISLIDGRLFMTNAGKVAVLDLSLPEPTWSVTTLVPDAPEPDSLAPARRRGGDVVVLHRAGALFVSTDGGLHFAEDPSFRIPDADALHPVSAVAFREQRVLVGFVGHVLPDAGPGGGVAISTDAGASFTRASSPHPLAIIDPYYQRIAVDGPRIAVASFATLNRLNSFEGRGYSPGLSLSTSDDDGQTWSHRWLEPSQLSASGCRLIWSPGALAVRGAELAVSYRCGGTGPSAILLSQDGQRFEHVPVQPPSGELPSLLWFGDAGLFLGGRDGLALLEGQPVRVRPLLTRPTGLLGDEARKYDIHALVEYDGQLTALSRDGLWRMDEAAETPVHVPGSRFGALPWNRYAYARSASRELVAYQAQAGFGPGEPVTLSSPAGLDVWTPFRPFEHEGPLSLAQAGDLIVAYAPGVLQASTDGGTRFRPVAMPAGYGWAQAPRTGGTERICLGTLCTVLARSAR